MADESYAAVYPDSKVNYTLSSYLDYLQQLRMKAKELNKAGKKSVITIKCYVKLLAGETKWSIHNVELALWSFHYMNRESFKKKRSLTTDKNLSVKRQRTM